MHGYFHDGTLHGVRPEARPSIVNNERSLVRGGMACAVSSGRTLFCFCHKGRNLVSFEFVSDTEPMVTGEAPVSRYSVTCPVCGERIRPVQFAIREGTFRCPECGKSLQYTRENIYFVLPASVVTAAILVYYFGYRGLMFTVVTFCVSLVIFVLGTSIAHHVHPPKAQQSFKNGNAGLCLTDKPPR